MRLIHIIFTTTIPTVGLILVCIVSYIPNVAYAAPVLLRMYPANATIGVDTDMTVGVFLSSPIYPVNAASAVISFPSNNLEVTSIEDTNSIFDFWIDKPKYSNDKGTIDFSGVAFNPGFSGNLGKVITIHFRSRLAGSANIKFASDLVLANDGKGTQLPVDDSNVLALSVLSTAPLASEQSSSSIDNIAQTLDTSQSLSILGRNSSALDIILLLLIIAIVIVLSYILRQQHRIINMNVLSTHVKPEDIKYLDELNSDHDIVNKKVQHKLIEQRYKRN